MSTLGILVLVCVAVALISGRSLTIPLALAGITASGAALTAGRVVIPTFYAVGTLAIVAVTMRCVAVRRTKSFGPVHRGVLIPLLAFCLWSVLVTLMSPMLFNGVSAPTPGETSLTAGTLSVSNVAQIAYLLIGVGVVFYVATDLTVGPRVISITIVGATILSGWRFCSITFGLPFPEGLFDNSPTFAYIETAAGGAERFRGIFSEPAALASSCLMSVAWAASSLKDSSGWRKIAKVTFAGVAIFMGIVSTSTTFLVAGLVLSTVSCLLALATFVTGRRTVSLSSLILIAGASVALVAFGPYLWAIATSQIVGKVDTSSFTDRSSLNSQLVNVYFDTLGLGVGLGAGRGSSFGATLLGTTGAIGVTLFALTICAALARSVTRKTLLPVAWVLVALMTTKLVAGPDLSDTTGILWLSLGLLAQSRKNEGIPTLMISPSSLQRPSL